MRVCVCMYTYVYIERETDRETESYTHTYTDIYITSQKHYISHILTCPSGKLWPTGLMTYFLDFSFTFH